MKIAQEDKIIPNVLCCYPSTTMQDYAFKGLSLAAYCHVEVVETFTASGFWTVKVYL